MKRIFLIIAALIAAAPMAQAQDYSADRVASAILQGYLQQDVTLIAPHSNATNEDFFAELLSGAESPSDLFDGARGAAGSGWDGMILPARYDDRGRAIVPFAIEGPTGPAALGSGVEGRYMVIVLTLDAPDDTTWGFEDINYFRRADYAGMADTR